ncbi:hypothetical protein MM239_10670 [Belliella sp. DSM 111904]|uniref:Uncharacterized protein n=1 Tax=Belliella filtrata TaxID=2923435 RepID=A0ABS9V0C4_9BACT|nr:hypothetical protein [Belliella filtrata]MCH7409859.1 hypothetical protein [Belliella filtrata]
MSNPIENLKYDLALSLVPKIGSAVFMSILAHAGSTKGFLDLTKCKASKISRISSSIMEIRRQFENNLPKLIKSSINVSRRI